MYCKVCKKWNPIGNSICGDCECKGYKTVTYRTIGGKTKTVTAIIKPKNPPIPASYRWAQRAVNPDREVLQGKRYIPYRRYA